MKPSVFLYRFTVMGAMALALLCFTVSCAKQPTASAYNKPIAQSEPSNPPNLQASPFSMVTAEGIEITGSGNKNGFYEIVLNDNGTKNILYTDYASQRRTFLCSNPNCTHNDETCTSWFDSSNATLIPAASDKCLLVFSNNRERGTSIVKMDVNGANRQVLHQFDSATTFDTSVAMNDEFAVLKMRCYESVKDGSASQGYNSKQSLVAIHLNTGEIYDLYALPLQNANSTLANTSTLFFVTVAAEGFVIKTISLKEYEQDENDADKTYANMLAATTHTLSLLNYKTLSLETLLTYSQGEVKEKCFANEIVYIKNYGSNNYSLMRLNFTEKENKVILSNLVENNIGNADVISSIEDFQIRERLNEYVTLYAVSQNGMNNKGDLEIAYSAFAIDCDTSEIIPLTLDNYYNATTVPIEVVSHTENLVLANVEVSEVFIPNTRFPILRKVRGIMTVEEYLNSTKNYQSIHDLS